MQRLLEKQKKLEMQAAKQQQQQAEELKNQSTKQSTNKVEKSNAIIDSRESNYQTDYLETPQIVSRIGRDSDNYLRGIFSISLKELN